MFPHRPYKEIGYGCWIWIWTAEQALIYFLLHRLQRRLPTAVQVDNYYFFIFDENGATAYDVRTRDQRTVARLSKCWALCDSNGVVVQPCATIQAHAQRIVITTSPKPDRWKEIRKQQRGLTVVAALPTVMEIAAVVKTLGLDPGATLGHVGKWGPSLRTTLGLLEQPAFALQHQAEAETAASALASSPERAFSIESEIGILPTDGGSSLFFLDARPGNSAGDLPIAFLRLPTKHLVEILEQHQAHGRPGNVHNKMSGGVELRLFRESEERSIRTTTNVLPGTAGTLKRNTGAASFYWIPSVVNFPGVDGVFGDDANDIFTVQATIAGEHRDADDGLRKAWAAGSEECQARNWHLVLMCESQDQARALLQDFSLSIRLGRVRKSVKLWARGTAPRLQRQLQPILRPSLGAGLSNNGPSNLYTAQATARPTDTSQPRSSPRIRQEPIVRRVRPQCSDDGPVEHGEDEHGNMPSRRRDPSSHSGFNLPGEDDGSVDDNIRHGLWTQHVLDVGTQPGPMSMYHLWKAFDIKSNVGACSEILIKPFVAAHKFGYKMSNIPDKPLESVFVHITVLPGAFSAYRYIALQNDVRVEGSLEKYFLGEKMPGAEADFFTANMYLAEDRILCWELVSKRGGSWIALCGHECAGSSPRIDFTKTSLAKRVLFRRRALDTRRDRELALGHTDALMARTTRRGIQFSPFELDSFDYLGPLNYARISGSTKRKRVSEADASMSWRPPQAKRCRKDDDFPSERLPHDICLGPSSSHTPEANLNSVHRITPGSASATESETSSIVLIAPTFKEMVHLRYGCTVTEHPVDTALQLPPADLPPSTRIGKLLGDPQIQIPNENQMDQFCLFLAYCKRAHSAFDIPPSLLDFHQKDSALYSHWALRVRRKILNNQICYVISEWEQQPHGFFIVVQSASTALEIVRQGWGPSLTDVMEKLLSRGMSFRTCCRSTTTSPAPMDPRAITYPGSGYRPPNWKPDMSDYRSYVEIRQRS
ncbi:hypothetical protein C8R47DRAFT_1214552 [Mycena vitilis]|nr:hypothetical protein C8R47DRAFT_1214552 [Mycena vitilis]